MYTPESIPNLFFLPPFALSIISTKKRASCWEISHRNLNLIEKMSGTLLS